MITLHDTYTCYTVSSSRYLEEPTMIAAFNGKQAGKHVVHIACGSTYSAVITIDGELYTWGRGNYGRLGHGKILLVLYFSFNVKASFVSSVAKKEKGCPLVCCRLQ